jgi:hypothetical protein
MVAFILFCDKVEGCIGVYTDWHESKAEIFQQVRYGELATFRELAEWVYRFAEDGVDWSNTLPEVVGTHPFLADQEFQEQYARFLADTIARCWVWTMVPQ